jgi:hypothetical protein
VKPENIPYYLQKSRDRDVVVEFDDGDRYPASALDITRADNDEEFDLYVSFDDCLVPSQGYARAVEDGPRKRTPGIGWTSTRPQQPVGKTYTPGDVKLIYDTEAGYCVYEKEAIA